MTGFSDIRDALFKIIDTAFPNVNLYGEEIQKGLTRPAFFINLLPEAGGMVNTVLRSRRMLVDICYFSDADASAHNRDLWEKADTLEELFRDTLIVGDRSLFIYDPQPEIVDEVLHYQFNLDFTDSREDVIVVELDPGVVPPGEVIPEQIVVPDPELGYIEDEVQPMRELEVEEVF